MTLTCIFHFFTELASVTNITSYFSSEPICVVTEFVSGGNLKDLLVKSRIDPLEEERPYINVKSTLIERQLIKMAVDIANGMRKPLTQYITRPSACSLPHSLAHTGHSLTNSLTHSLNHSLTRSNSSFCLSLLKRRTHIQRKRWIELVICSWFSRQVERSG